LNPVYHIVHRSQLFGGSTEPTLCTVFLKIQIQAGDLIGE
jgi:hypothetical protein